MTPPSGENVHFVDTELQVLLQALDAYRPPAIGPEETLRIRTRKKVAAALIAAQRPFVERA